MICIKCCKEIKPGEKSKFDWLNERPFHISCPVGASAAQPAASGFASSSGSASAAAELRAFEEIKKIVEQFCMKDVKAGDETLDLSRAVQLPVSDLSGKPMLLDCPFCGTAARHVGGHLPFHISYNYSVRCPNCQATIERRFYDQAAAAEQWNKRAGVNAATPDSDTPQRVSSGGS